MIIILGPDCSGKTTLAAALEADYHHFTQESGYDDYLRPLADLKLFDGVADRFIFCEKPYAAVMGRKFKFSLKQWHNIILLSLAQNPLIILCTHKPSQSEYSKEEQYLPYERWDNCLTLYRTLLDSNHLTYVEYDYTNKLSTSVFLSIESKYRGKARWWVPMWKDGIGMIGSHSPETLLVAQNIGPNNMNSIPFETGPTGLMLSDMLEKTRSPLGDIAITNMIKAPRGSTRPINADDMIYFEAELTHLQPKKVVFMGKTAQAGIPLAKEHDIPHYAIPHLGYYHHKGVTDMGQYYSAWRSILGGSKPLWGSR